MIDAEARQRVRQEVLDGGGPAVDSQPAAVGRAQSAELHRQDDIVAPALAPATDEKLVMSGSKEISGVD